MTDKQKEFLQLAVIDRITYSEIEKQMGIARSEFAPWWDELKCTSSKKLDFLIRSKVQIIL